MKIRPSTAFTLALLVLVSCTYEPEETFFKEIQVPEINVALSLNSYDNVDSIYLWNDASFTYSLDDGPGKLERVEILIDNHIVKTGTSTTGGFSMKRQGENNQYLKTGVHELKIQFITSTGTGSLADLVGAEKIQVWKKWTLVIDISPPPVPVIQFSIENGFLKLSWNKYTKPNFQYYYLWRYDENRKSTYKKFTNADQNYWLDSTYVGGYSQALQYQVSTVALETSVSQSVQKNDSYTFTAKKINPADSTVAVTWSKCKYPGAFKEYRIDHTVTLKQNTNINDTTATVKFSTILFGADHLLYHRVVPRYKTNYVPSADRSVKVRLGNKLKQYGVQIFYKKDINKFVGWGSSSYPNYVYIYNPDMSVADSLSIPASSSFTCRVPYSGPYVYHFNSFGHGSIDLITKSTIVSAGSFSRFNGGGTGNGLFSYNSSYINAQKRQVYVSKVVELATNTEIFSDAQFSSNSLTISEDGKFIRTTYPNNKISKLNGGTTTVVGTFSFNFSGFRADKPNEILSSRSNALDIYDANNLVLLRTLKLPFPSYWDLYYDPATKFVIGVYDGSTTVYLVHIESGEIKTFKTHARTFVNGTFIDSSGYYYKAL